MREVWAAQCEYFERNGWEQSYTHLDTQIIWQYNVTGKDPKEKSVQGQFLPMQNILHIISGSAHTPSIPPLKLRQESEPEGLFSGEGAMSMLMVRKGIRTSGGLSSRMFSHYRGSPLPVSHHPFVTGWFVTSQNSYDEALTSSISGCDYIWREVFKGIIKLK